MSKEPITWGPEIPTPDGRPGWLVDDAREVDVKTSLGWRWIGGNFTPPDRWAWDVITAIRLPATHWAYTALSAGFEPWGGGEGAPADWDGGETLLRGGAVVHSTNWRWSPRETPLPGGAAFDIIGYRRTQPLGEGGEAGENWRCFHCGDTFTDIVSAGQHFGPYGDTPPLCFVAGEDGGLPAAFRALEAKYTKLLEDTCEEQGSVAREFWGLGAKHTTDVMRAEEKGYSRGLKDGRAATPPDTVTIARMSEAGWEQWLIDTGQVAGPGATLIRYMVEALRHLNLISEPPPETPAAAFERATGIPVPADKVEAFDIWHKEHVK